MMTRPDRNPRLAVLIDADNASPRIAAGLFEEIAKIGEASVRRIYGDFSSSRSQGWADVLSRYAIIPQQQFAYVTGKNASDITLVIDAMDLLHSGRLDGFCLVSSDSDFTRLAARIREQGIDVFGFGEKKTPESFRQACRRFIYTENLLPERAAAERAGTARPLEQPETASDLLKRVIDQMDTEDGWVSLGTFGKQLAAVASDFDPRTFGFKKLSDLIRSTEIFELDDGEPGRIRVRLKPGRNGRRPAGPRPLVQAAPVTAAERRPASQPATAAIALPAVSEPAGTAVLFSEAQTPLEAPNPAARDLPDPAAIAAPMPVQHADNPPNEPRIAPATVAIAPAAVAPTASDLRADSTLAVRATGRSARSAPGAAQGSGTLPPPPSQAVPPPAARRPAASAASESGAAGQAVAAGPQAPSRRNAVSAGTVPPRLPLSPAALVAHITARDAPPPAPRSTPRRRVRPLDPPG